MPDNLSLDAQTCKFEFLNADYFYIPINIVVLLFWKVA